MSRSRKKVLSNALKAEVGGAPADLDTLFTDERHRLVAVRHRVRADSTR